MKRNRKPHSEETKAKMRLAAANVVHLKRWVLPEAEIVSRLLNTADTTRSIAKEYGCSDATIKVMLRRHTDAATRLRTKLRKQGATIKRIGGGNPELWRYSNWTGRKHTDAARQKQSASKKGRVLPLQTRIAQSARLQGISADKWCGFATTETLRQRKSAQLKAWRIAVFERDDHTCLMCGRRGGILHVHHVHPFAKYPELRFDVNNGATLCAKPCHKKTIGREALFVELLTQTISARILEFKKL